MPRSHATARTLLVACLGLAVAGCAGGGLGEQKVPTSVEARPAPPIDVPSLDGVSRIRSADLVGRPTIVNFWASYCAPCRTEMPALAAFARAHPEVRMLGIAVAEPPAASRAFATKAQVGYDNGVDRNGALFNRFGAPGLPSTYVLDSRGRLARTVVGPLDLAELEALTVGVP